MLQLAKTKPTEITIMPVNNGWVVFLPQNAPAINAGEIMQDVFSHIRDAAEHEETDKVLSKILKEQREKEKREENNTEIKIQRENTVYIFKEFCEVLAFLSAKIHE
jgi:hypothetical protein